MMQKRLVRRMASLVILSLFLLLTWVPAAGVAASGPQDTHGARLLSSTEAGVAFDVTVPWNEMDVEPSGSHYVRVSLPGWQTTSRSGEPMLPSMIQMIGVPSEAVVSVHVQPGRAHTVVLPAPLVPVAGQEIDWDPAAISEAGVALPEPRLVIMGNPAIYTGEGEYPGVLAEVSNDAVVRQQRVVSVAVYPVQYHPASQQLTVYESLHVEVTFQNPPMALLRPVTAESAAYEAVLRQQLLNYDNARQWREVPVDDRAAVIDQQVGEGTGITAMGVPWAPPEPGWRVKVRADGFYKLTYTQTLAAGLPVATLDPRTFQLYGAGSEVAIFVAGQEDGVFNDVDFVLFYGQAVASKYTMDNVYWLTYGHGTGLRMGTRDGTPLDADTPPYYVAQKHMERNRYYVALTPGVDDLERWHWDYIYPPTARPTVTNSFTLTAPYAGEYPASVKVALLGYEDNELNPDHHARISVNGTQIADVTWDGIAWKMVNEPIPQGLLVAGSNNVSITCLTDTGVSYDIVFLDWEQLEYANTFRAEGDALAFRYDVNGTWKFQVDGFSSNQVAVYDVTAPGAVVRLDGVAVDSSALGYMAQFQDTLATARSYWAVGSTAYAPVQAIEPDTASSLRLTSNGADHIIISHSAFMTQALQLRDFRAGQGLRAMAVDVQDVYDEFGYGVVGAGAIHDFVAYAYAQWQAPPPSYIVLVGDGHYDPKNYLGYGRTSFMPPYLAFADPWLGETAVDNRYVTVAGGDTFPDLMLGRLAVNNSAQASAFVNKIVAYEESPGPGDWTLRVLAVADNADAAGDFPLASDELLTDYLPAPYFAEKIYLGITHATAAAAKAAITATINSGALIVNYFGHAGIPQWADENLFSLSDVAALTNALTLPVILPMTCYDGFYQNPHSASSQDALGETITRAAGKGAVASWSPSGLGLATGHDYLDRGFFESVFSHGAGQPTVGEGTIGGKLMLWATGNNLDLIDTYLLFGDPAVTLPITGPTAVDLLWFDATAEAGYVELSWETASEVDTVGFNVYRAVQVDGPRVKINTGLIPSHVAPGSSDGAVYSFQDRSARPNRTYYYWLEDVDIYGHTGLEGPLSARRVK